MKRLILPTSVLILGGLVGWYGYPSLATESFVTPKTTLLSDTGEATEGLTNGELGDTTILHAYPTYFGRLSFRVPTRWHAQSDPARYLDNQYQEHTGQPSLRQRIYFRTTPTATADEADMSGNSGTLMLWDPTLWQTTDDDESMGSLTKTQKQNNLTLLRAIYEQRSLVGAEEQLTNGAACVMSGACVTPLTTHPLAGGDFHYVESSDGHWRGYRWAVAEEGNGNSRPIAYAILGNFDFPRPLIVDLRFPLWYPQLDDRQKHVYDQAADPELDRLAQQSPLAIQLELSRIDRFLRTLKLEVEKSS